MSLRELAESDLALTLERDGSTIILVDLAGSEHTVVGTVGDVKLLVEPEKGEAVRARSIVCCVRINTLAEKTPVPPTRGWRARVQDLRGNTLNLFVQGVDSDRTLGVYRLVMGLDARVEEDDEV